MTADVEDAEEAEQTISGDRHGEMRRGVMVAGCRREMTDRRRLLVGRDGTKMGLHRRLTRRNADAAGVRRAFRVLHGYPELLRVDWRA